MGDKLAAAFHGSTPADIARRVTTEIRQLADGITPGDWWVSPTLTPANVFAGNGYNMDPLVAAETSKSDGKLIAAAPKLLRTILATLDAHPNENGQCGSLCQDSPDYEYPCRVVQEIVDAWTA